jgi:hypothetical protein
MTVCPRCQQPLSEPPERYCTRCGSELAPGDASTIVPGAPPPVPEAPGDASTIVPGRPRPEPEPGGDASTIVPGLPRAEPPGTARPEPTPAGSDDATIVAWAPGAGTSSSEPRAGAARTSPRAEDAGSSDDVTIVAPLPPPIPPPPPRAAEGRALAAEPGRRTAPEAELPPWERRDTLGLGAAFLDTTRAVLFAPRRFFGRMPPGGGAGDPLGYGMLAGFVGILASAVYRLVMDIVSGGRWVELPYLEPLRRFGNPGVMFFVIQILLGPVMLLLMLVVLAALLHGALMLFGGARRGFEASFRVVCYAEAVSVLGLIPLCGEVAAIPYFLVVWVVGLAAAHGVGAGRSLAAVGLVFTLCCCPFALLGALGAMGGLAGHLP